MGKQIAKLEGAALSTHPTHAFAGVGGRVIDALAQHGYNDSCFAPIDMLAAKHDFSMLLIGCCDESPGFSTVHTSQNRLGLTRRHLLRYLYRWDELVDGQIRSKIAPEAPGCSASFSKFYPYYEREMNLVTGEWDGVQWVFVPSARIALSVEYDILKDKGRFVDCGRVTCLSCRLRFY